MSLLFLRFLSLSLWLPPFWNHGGSDILFRRFEVGKETSRPLIMSTRCWHVLSTILETSCLIRTDCDGFRSREHNPVVNIGHVFLFSVDVLDADPSHNDQWRKSMIVKDQKGETKKRASYRAYIVLSSRFLLLSIVKLWLCPIWHSCLPQPNVFFPFLRFLWLPPLSSACTKIYWRPHGDDRQVTASRFCVCEGCINAAAPCMDDGKQGTRGFVQIGRMPHSMQHLCWSRRHIWNHHVERLWWGLRPQKTKRGGHVVHGSRFTDHHEDHFAVTLPRTIRLTMRLELNMGIGLATFVEPAKLWRFPLSSVRF